MVVHAPEPSSASELPNVTVLSGGSVSAPEAERVAFSVGRVLAHRGISEGARVRLTTANYGDGAVLVQVNFQVRDSATRLQTVIAGHHDLPTALLRLDRQIVRLCTQWRPRPWPDHTRRMLTAVPGGVISRRKPAPLLRGTPLAAVAMMDAMDYDVHLFTDAETGEDAVVYRAGPSGLRLARQRRMYPPGWSWAPATGAPQVPLIVNSRPTPTFSEADAVHWLCAHNLRFLFFSDPETGRGHLLYARHDGNLGLIRPDLRRE
ncbi:sigma 54 modulation/S30EA ribosomal C-terminal domain-containing protein [Mycolicibacterium gadium]|uniref:Sigma 54 modulation/S30EA ribosomal C-terminal domain-containing protein n=2 Tax=Mycolicibacterium gadium TaxID=1794 RepID=A0ABT6GZI8_MYCGU|nr:sigma 54 modulation/S30EA ribosomal C-terminal domain-containing protein [Mycolicibacterium gadium]